MVVATNARESSPYVPDRDAKPHGGMETTETQRNSTLRDGSANLAVVYLRDSVRTRVADRAAKATCLAFAVVNGQLCQEESDPRLPPFLRFRRPLR